MSFQPGRPRSACMTRDPSGSRRSSRPSGEETITRRPSGSQSVHSGSDFTRAITSLWPVRSTASTSPADQSEKYSRSPCHRGDSTSPRPVSSVRIPFGPIAILSAVGSVYDCRHSVDERRPAESTGWFDVVVDAGRGQQPVRTAFVDTEARLWREVLAAPADAVVLQGAAHPVVGYHAMLQLDAAARAEALGEERAELGGAAVGGVRADGLAVVPTWFEGAHHRVGVASLQRGLIAADDVTWAVGAWFEDGWAQVAPSVDGPLAAIGAEHHRQLVGGLGDDRHRPRQLLPVVVQVRQQFHHRPAAGRCGGDGLDPGMVLLQPGLIPADEVSQLPVAADLAGPGVVDHHLARPRILEDVGVAPAQCGEVL